MIRISFEPNFLTIFWIPIVNAFVLVMIWNTPPMINTKASTSIIDWIPLPGAINTCQIPCRRLVPSSSTLSTVWYVPATATLRSPVDVCMMVRSNSPLGTIHVITATTSIRKKISVSTWGIRNFNFFSFMSPSLSFLCVCFFGIYNPAIHHGHHNACLSCILCLCL